MLLRVRAHPGRGATTHVRNAPAVIEKGQGRRVDSLDTISRARGAGEPCGLAPSPGSSTTRFVLLHVDGADFAPRGLFLHTSAALSPSAATPLSAI